LFIYVENNIPGFSGSGFFHSGFLLSGNLVGANFFSGSPEIGQTGFRVHTYGEKNFFLHRRLQPGKISWSVFPVNTKG
jgi:hypothetical protein